MRKATFWRRKDVADAICKPLNKERTKFCFFLKKIKQYGPSWLFFHLIAFLPSLPQGARVVPSATMACPIYHNPCQQDIVLYITILFSRTLSYLSQSLLAGQKSNDLTSIIVSCCRGSMKLLMPQAIPSIKLQFITLLQAKVNIIWHVVKKQYHLR